MRCPTCGDDPDDYERFPNEQNLKALEKKSWTPKERRSLGMTARNTANRAPIDRAALLRCLLMLYVIEAG
jgi:hypothetical protein